MLKTEQSQKGGNRSPQFCFHVFRVRKKIIIMGEVTISFTGFFWNILHWELANYGPRAKSTPLLHKASDKLRNFFYIIT